MRPDRRGRPALHGARQMAGGSRRGQAAAAPNSPAEALDRIHRPEAMRSQCSAVVLVVRVALRAVTGSEITDQRNRLGSFLSASAVKTCVPSGRSLGAMVIGTSNCGLKVLADVQLGILAAHEHRNLAGTPGGSALTALSAPGRRAVSFFTSGATAGVAGASAVALTGSAGFSAALDSSRFGLGSLGLRNLGFKESWLLRLW